MNKKENGSRESDSKINEVGREIFGEEIVEDDRATDEKKDEEDEAVDKLIKGEDYSAEANSAIEKTFQKQRNVNSETPATSSGDIDADWSTPNGTGEESSLGSSATPDQDRIDPLFEPWGTQYSDDEELDILKKSRKLESEKDRDDENK